MSLITDRRQLLADFYTMPPQNREEGRLVALLGSRPARDQPPSHSRDLRHYTNGEMVKPCTRGKRSRPAAAATTSRVLFATSALCASSVRAFDAPSAAAACVAGPRARSRSSRLVMRAMPDWSDIGKLPKKTSHARASSADADAEHSGHEVTSLGAFGNFTKTSSARLSIDDEALVHFDTPSSSTKSMNQPKVQHHSDKLSSKNRKQSTHGMKAANNDWIGAWGAWRDPSGSGTSTSGNKPMKSSGNKISTPTPKQKSVPPTSAKPISADDTKPLTVSDLQRILADGGYVRKSDLDADSSRSKAGGSGHQVGGIAKASTSDSLSGVKTAFPQPSILSYKGVQVGTMLVSALFGLIIATSVTRNLWLFGAVAGGVYGSSIAQDTNNPDLSPAAQFLVDIGRSVATRWLRAWDFATAMWFMYKTGELSYDYWKRYEDLDRRLGLTDKVDAWNARFVQGKQGFDRWEQDNEVGRKVLATLRTMWMVEEQSYQRQFKERKDRMSKNAVVKYIQNFFAWMRRVLIAGWNIVAVDRQGELKEFVAGIKVQLSKLMSTRVVIQRAGSAISLLVLVNFIGALFASSPGVLSMVALICGIIWPDWAGLTLERIMNIVDETRALGRGEDSRRSSSLVSIPSSSSAQASEPVRFSFFERRDGSKRFYRTGRPLIAWTKLNGENQSEKTPEQHVNNFLLAINPFADR